MFDSYREEIYGKAEGQYTRARAWVVTTSVLYASMAAMTIIYAMNSAAAYWMPSAMLVLFCIWRIHRIHMPVAVLCRDYFLVLAPGKKRDGGGWTDFLFQSVYLVVPYRTIAGFSSRWNEMYLGKAEAGGMTRVSVPLAFMARRDKDRVYAFIEKKQREGRAVPPVD